jgi:transketolase
MQNLLHHNDSLKILSEADPTRKTALIQALAQECRIDVLDTLHDKQTGHWGGASSCAELLATLYFDFLRVNPAQPKDPDRDRLVISKGHASCMIYTLLAKRGFFPQDEVRRDFRQLNTRMQGHPCMNKTPGVEMSTGALGHGISVTTGMALAAGLQKKDFWSMVLVGDGCLNEGESWEGIMSAAKFQPRRLVILVDYNKVQLDGPAAEIMPLDPLPEKFRAFNCNVAERVYDGHSVADIQASFAWLRQQDHWPAVIIYKTHKGHGVSFTSDNHKWHGPPIDDASYAKARPELLTTLETLKGAL